MFRASLRQRVGTQDIVRIGEKQDVRTTVSGERCRLARRGGFLCVPALSNLHQAMRIAAHRDFRNGCARTVLRGYFHTPAFFCNVRRAFTYARLYFAR
jgi:hypothetical protein